MAGQNRGTLRRPETERTSKPQPPCILAKTRVFRAVGACVDTSTVLFRHLAFWWFGNRSSALLAAVAMSPPEERSLFARYRSLRSHFFYKRHSTKSYQGPIFRPHLGPILHRRDPACFELHCCLGGLSPQPPTPRQTRECICGFVPKLLEPSKSLISLWLPFKGQYKR